MEPVPDVGFLCVEGHGVRVTLDVSATGFLTIRAGTLTLPTLAQLLARALHDTQAALAHVAAQRQQQARWN